MVMMCIGTDKPRSYLKKKFRAEMVIVFLRQRWPSGLRRSPEKRLDIGGGADVDLLNFVSLLFL